MKPHVNDIRLVVFDVDGVLTDGQLVYGAGGEEQKVFHARDGLGLRLLMAAGLEVAVISAKTGFPLKKRLSDLGISRVHLGQTDKASAVQAVADSVGVALSHVAFVGDDLLDIPAMEQVGLELCPADAHPRVVARAHRVSSLPGGRGAVRDLVDWLLQEQGRLETAERVYLKRERANQPRPFGVLIPARYASARLPGKALADLNGKPLTVRVVENALRAGAAFCAVATDDDRIVDVVRAHGAQAILTDAGHTCGTDRLAEAAVLLGLADDTIIVNLQGDEPLVPPRMLQQLATQLDAHPSFDVATMAVPIESAQELFDPNVVKVTLDASGNARAFSRAPIPWMRDVFSGQGAPEGWQPDPGLYFRHLGLYAYRCAALKRIAAHPPVASEMCERLEQLRALHMGLRIHVTVVPEAPPPGVDTQADLGRVRAVLAAQVPR